MLIMKLALLSCAFYLGFALIVELANIGARMKGLDLHLTSLGWTVFSGAIWLVSTSVAFRIVASGIRARLAR